MPSEQILFHAGAKVEVVAGKGAPIPRENLLAVFIKELRVDPRNFRSQDLGPNREGVVELIVAGEATIIPYSGVGPVHEKYLRRVAYLGRNPGALGISVGVTESDEESRRLLDKASGVAEALSGALPGRGTPWGLILGPIAPAFGLVASLLRFLRGNVDDDEEVRVFATTERPMSHGAQISVKFHRRGKEVFFVLLEVEDLGAPTNQAGGFSVRIARPELFLEDVEIGVRKGSVRSPKKGWMSRPDAGLSPVKSGDYLRRMKWFGCQAGSGIARFQYETLRSETGEVLTWDKAEIFQAAAPKLKSDRHCLPLTLSFSLYPDRAELSPLTGVVTSGVELVQSLLEGGNDKEGKALLADVAPYVRKSAPSMAALLAEISEGRFSLFSMEGMLVLLPKGQKGSMDPESPRLLLEWVEQDKVWRGTMRCKLEWRGVRVGQFRFGVEVAEI
ncbi:MAG: hypothetical protein EBV83_06295 [Verrucomicrobia bacterium]|nr:hypothetical protein [Verrucomicrobiota bacterium]